MQNHSSERKSINDSSKIKKTSVFTKAMCNPSTLEVMALGDGKFSGVTASFFG